MIDEKILKNEKLEDEELEKVSGGVGTADENNSSEGSETGIIKIFWEGSHGGH